MTTEMEQDLKKMHLVIYLDDRKIYSDNYFNFFYRSVGKTKAVKDCRNNVHRLVKQETKEGREGKCLFKMYYESKTKN